MKKMFTKPQFINKKKLNKKELLALSPNDRLFDDDMFSDFTEYESFLKLAFKNRRIRNLAITGNHGIGKSSIIHSFESKDKNCGNGYLYISLMDFNNDRGFEYARVGEDIAEDIYSKEQVQQEFERYLLCQILSRLDAQSLPHCTFRLIPSKNKLLRIILSLFLAIVALCLYGIAFNSAMGIPAIIIKGLHCICGISCATLVFTIAFIISHNFETTKFTASYSGMKIETQIETTTGSYIDDHIFEIVYALETIAKNIGYTVVLEDMDRLGRYICIDIFSKMRRINYLVNDRKKLKKKYIRFIYAFDDSVFELTKNTKFFDYVMSVTPMLNYNTSGKYFKDLILNSLSEETNGQRKLRKIIQQYDLEFWEHIGMVVHDYRMLNHIRNDFRLFVNIMLNRKYVPNTKWLPFVVYKTVLAEDYCKAFEEKSILELDKDNRNKKIEELCVEKGEKYSELLKLFFDYLINQVGLDVKDFQQFTGLPQKVIDIRNACNDYSEFKEIFNAKIEPNQVVKKLFTSKRVLVTGGGGTIGGEICRQLVTYDIETLIIVDISANACYNLQKELLIHKPKQLHIEIASICDTKKIDSIVEKYQPNIIIHAAAYNYESLIGKDPEDVIKTNIIGTYNIICASEKIKVEKFVLISMDQAVFPPNIVGATKRFCELLVNSKQNSDTIFYTVKLSSGIFLNSSVIPLFRRQIERGGPVSIADKRMIRYFMTIQEMAQLVLQSGYIACQSQTFILDMGTPIKVLSLAENLIRLYGLKPYEDINIIQTGLAPGEWLYEHSTEDYENLSETKLKKVYLMQNTDVIEFEKLNDIIQRLDKEIEKGASNKLVEIIKEVVPMSS